MIYNEFCGKKLSALGFGAMRLPTLESGAVDEALTKEMLHYAIDHGVNYFDTAWPYHGGHSERILGEVLGQLPRDSYYLADKYPGHQLSSSYDPAGVFETQLARCGVEYFDFYLLHNVCEMSLPTYTDERWGIVEYFIEQRKAGRIRHLGFSSHAGVECLGQFLDLYGGDMEFCQIQLNYLDWTLQDAKGKYELLESRGIPVWVMEPVRGGKLASLPAGSMAKLQDHRPDAPAVEWCLRFLQGLPNVTVTLSGMSNMEQLKQNISIYEKAVPLNDAEFAALMDVADGMKDSVPCTACRYCVDGCPVGLNIPLLLSLRNEQRYSYAMNIGIRVDSLEEGKRPSDCIGCGQCTQICPQKIDIPGELNAFAQLLAQKPSWAQICREREEAARKMKG